MTSYSVNWECREERKGWRGRFREEIKCGLSLSYCMCSRAAKCLLQDNEPLKCLRWQRNQLSSQYSCLMRPQFWHSAKSEMFHFQIRSLLDSRRYWATDLSHCTPWEMHRLLGPNKQANLNFATTLATSLGKLCVLSQAPHKRTMPSDHARTHHPVSSIMLAGRAGYLQP